MRPIVFDRWRYPNDNFDRHTYPKGAVILNMMRWLMGDAAFRQTISHFLNKHAFQPVDSHDFMKAIKEATGQNMDWFIEQWIFRPGHPVFEVSYDWNEAAKKLNLKIAQTQDTSGDVLIYKTPVIMGIHTTRGRTSKKLWLEKREEVFELDVGKKPLLVRFDEGNYLLKEWTFEKQTRELLYQLGNDDVIGRMWAASELIKHGDDSSTLDALFAVARGDPFWGVRRSAVEAIGKIAGKDQIPFLKAKALDESSQVRVAALEALGNTGEPQLASFFYERFRADDSYLAQAEVLRSIGKTGNISAVDLLDSASKMKSPRDVIRRAALQALEQINK
jgi:aminopeptidase N